MNFLLYLFIVCCIYQIPYQLVLIFVIIKKKKSQNLKISSELKSVSIIICAKNEAANLQKNLPFILEQNYPNFEVIIVDDNSTDNTNEIIKTQQLITNNLYLITISKEEKIGLGKKYALQKGVEAAKNELILLTDADCQPTSKNWILEMASCVNEKHKIVLGISPYKTGTTLLDGLIEYETAQTAMQYIGFAILGNPYMSVGRNVLYDAALLKTKKWTTQELSIASGDDDLAIQTLATKENTTVCLSKDSYTISDAKNTWKDFIKQKLRHYESGSLYKFSHRLLLGSYVVTKLFIYFGLVYFFLRIVLMIDYPTFFLFPFFFYSIYLFSTSYLNLVFNNTLKLNPRWYFTILNDFLYCMFAIILGLISQLKPTKNWK